MKVFTRDYRITGGYDEVFEKYFRGMKPCVFDIETTGTSTTFSKVVLTGLLTKTESCCRVTQFLAENHYEEYKVLDATMEFVRSQGIDYLITYNGITFDVPFINRRLSTVSNDAGLSLYNFDLLKFVRQNTDLKKRIGSLSQKSLENYYDMLTDRGDTITGRESVALFNEYTLSGNSTVEKIILTHNREDVLHLHRLMYAVTADISDMHSAMSKYGFPALGGRFTLRPCIRKNGRGANSRYSLIINGDQHKDAFSAAYFPDIDSPVTAEFNSSTHMLLIEVPVNKVSDEIIDAPGAFYLDTSSVQIDASGDPDCINNYLILNSRTINLAAKLLIDSVLERCGI